MNSPVGRQTMHSWSHTGKKADRWGETGPAMKKKMTRMTTVKRKVHHGVWLPLHAGDSHDMKWSQLFTLTPLRLNRPCSSADISNSSIAAAALNPNPSSSSSSSSSMLMYDCGCHMCSLQHSVCEHAQNEGTLSCPLSNSAVLMLVTTIATAQHHMTERSLPMLLVLNRCSTCS